MDDDNLLASVTADIQALEDSGAGLPFIFTPSQAFSLLSVLQLALRHPAVANAEPQPAHFAKSLAEEIERRLCLTDSLREIARRG